MRIIKTYNTKFNCDWFSCTIDDTTKSSPRREDVEAWRDDILKNSDYYRELKELTNKSIAAYYDSKTREDNYTGD